MYRPAAFDVDDESAVELARRAGFGHLVVFGDDGFDAAPVPFLIDDAATAVRLHVARANRLWRRAPCAAVLIVPISDTYVSPAWYPSKAEHGKVVPTWNYEVVHLHGELHAHHDAEWVRAQIDDLTQRNEGVLAAAAPGHSAWHTTDAPDGYIEQVQRAIVGIELRVERIEAKRKLSQNRDAVDAAGALLGITDSGLRGGDDVAGAMRSLGR